MDVDAYDNLTRRLSEVTGYHPPNERGGWRCPAHDDGRASLSVSRGAKGGVVLHCHAGCDLAAILERLGLTETDLFDRDEHGNGNGTRAGGPEIVDTYDYVDEHGRLLYQTVRMWPKDFRQRRPDGAGGWIWKLDNVRRVIYRLPRVIEAVKTQKRVWICEGEKDVHAFEARGEVATCNPMGAGHGKWRPEFNDAFRGAKVTVVADADQPGRAHANEIMTGLIPAVRWARLVEPKLGKDAADHFAAGFGVDEFVGDPEPRPVLEFYTAAEHAARVDGAVPVTWLARPIWPGDAYGIIAADEKAGKTWAVLDLAVAVAAGRSWMGVFPIVTPGPVVVCLGEGGERKMLRRYRAICEANGVTYDDLPIHNCFRVPVLTSAVQLDLLAERCEAVHPVLVIIDPLYLAARGASGSQLYEMGEHLADVQVLVQRIGSALVIVHHWNKTGEGRGAKRMTGVGGQQWGRVLVSMAVLTKSTDEATKESRVVMDILAEGDEIPDETWRVRREVVADDPDDMNSALHYAIYKLDPGIPSVPEYGDLPPSQSRIIRILEAATDWLSVRQIGDLLTTDETGKPLKARTIQDACKGLAGRGLAVPHGEDAKGLPWSWRAINAVDEWGRPAFDNDPATNKEADF